MKNANLDSSISLLPYFIRVFLLFQGKPEHLVNYLFYVAEEVRGIMAGLGIRKFQDLVGRADLLRPMQQPNSEKSGLLDFQALFHTATSVNRLGNSVCSQDFNLEARLDNTVIEEALPVLDGFAQEVRYVRWGNFLY